MILDQTNGAGERHVSSGILVDFAVRWLKKRRTKPFSQSYLKHKPNTATVRNGLNVET